jgi:hypothetical protein
MTLDRALFLKKEWGRDEAKIPIPSGIYPQIYRRAWFNDVNSPPNRFMGVGVPRGG